MPTVNIDKELLFAELGRSFSKKKLIFLIAATEEFDDLCFAFGIELEEEVKIIIINIKERLQNLKWQSRKSVLKEQGARQIEASTVSTSLPTGKQTNK